MNKIINQILASFLLLYYPQLADAGDQKVMHDWTLFHQVFQDYPEAAIILDTDLVVRSVSRSYCEHIKPPVDSNSIIGVNMRDLAKGRVSDEEQYLGDLQRSIYTRQKIITNTMDIEGSQYEMETVPIFDANQILYALRHSIKNIIKHTPEEYISLLRSASNVNTWRILAESISGYAIFVVDLHFNIQTWTKSAEYMYGWKPEEIIGLPYSKLQSRTGSPIALDPINREHVRQISHLTKEKNEIVVEEQISTILVSDVLVGHTVILRDMTRERMNEKLLLQEKEKTQTLQTNFLASISHESRSPTAIIVSTIENLLDTELTTEQQTLCDDIHSAGQMLLQVVEDILNYSKFITQGISLKSEEFSIRQVVGDLVRLHTKRLNKRVLHYIFKKHPIDINGNIAEDVPEILIGDKIRITQLISNLLNNAIKFTEEGHVTVRVEKCEDQYPEMVCLAISVIDTGCGVSEAHRKKLFQQFFQTDAGFGRKYSGTGLGLTNVKLITEAMNGEIKVDSVLDEGSTFTCKIHLFMPPEKSKEMTKENSSNSLLDAHPTLLQRIALPHRPKSYNLPDQILEKHILIVEDNEVMARICLRNLEKLGFKSLKWVEDGKDAVEYVKNEENRVALTLMDLMMKEVHGLEATRMIRKFNQKVIIIALTSNALEEDRKMCLDVGMTDFATKPISIGDLNELMKKHLA